jgi:hypothetical protein
LGGGDAGGDRPAAGEHDSGEVSMRRRVRDVMTREVVTVDEEVS